MKYAGVIPNDTVDCLHGLCVSFWFQGCPHHCAGCHNPETWDFNGGYDLPDDYIDKLIQLIDKNGIQRSFSLLGGEPFCEQNIEIAKHILDKISSKFYLIDIYAWSGYTYEELIKRDPHCLDNVDFLIDGKFDLASRDITLPLRGSPNQRIIDVNRSCPNGQIYCL